MIHRRSLMLLLILYFLPLLHVRIFFSYKHHICISLLHPVSTSHYLLSLKDTQTITEASQTFCNYNTFQFYENFLPPHSFRYRFNRLSVLAVHTYRLYRNIYKVFTKNVIYTYPLAGVIYAYYAIIMHISLDIFYNTLYSTHYCITQYN